jgi:hypothetical protein
MATPLEMAGAQPQKQPLFVPLFIDRAFTGLYTQRNVLHDPSDLATARFYGGRPDALIGGMNVELTNRLTLQRRPGLSVFSTAVYPSVPLRSFPFQLNDGSGTIQVLVDCGSTGSLVISAAGNASGGSTIYTGTFPNGASNAYVGFVFQVAGFVTNANNNGTFVCTASTTTTLTLSNALGVAESHAATAISAGAVFFDQQNGSKTFLFGKNPGAGQSNFVAVAGVVYVGDGVDTWKYTPGNSNGTIWNYGIAAPTAPPSVVITESANAAVPWSASTVFSTMGLLVDSNGNIQRLNTVNLLANTGQTGSTGNGQPVWNNTAGATTTETGGLPLTWTSNGQVGLWQPNTVYANQAAIYDPVTNCIFTNFASSGNPSGSTKPHFNAIPGSFTFEYAGIIPINKWGNDGVVGTATGTFSMALWKPSTAYVHFDTGGGPMFVLEPNLIGPTTTQPVYLQHVSSGSGTSGPSYSPVWATGVGGVTSDNQVGWVCLGPSAWAASTNYFSWVAGASLFSVVIDTAGTPNFWVCTGSGRSGTSVAFPASPNYGDSFKDNTVTWTCVGPQMTWVANTKWYLPSVGFAPPGPSQPFGSASIVDSNGNLEYVTTSGLSGGAAPAWPALNASIGILNLTTDNAAKWTSQGAAPANALVWTSGHVYAYSFGARLTSDPSNTVAPPGYPRPLGPPLGSETGGISTASPVFTITGPNTGAVNTISGVGSLDPQVDTIFIWRDADGGGSSNMFYLTEIPAPPPINGTAQPWSFQDFLPDTPTSQFPGLDNLIPAPVGGSNNPPPSTFLPMIYNFERIWGANGNEVQFSGGPDVITGNGNESYLTADEFPYLSTVVRIVKSSQGSIVFLADGIEIIAGGPQTTSFYSVTLATGIGLQSYNALDSYAGEIYFLSADGQFRVMNPSLNVSNAGFPIGDKLAAFNPATAYVAVQQSGVDNAIFIADGSTGWYRVNPHQVPGGASGPEPIWSPFAFITNGCQMVQSVEVSRGIKKLLVGPTSGGSSILQRDLTVFTDNLTPYDAQFTMGSITLAHPGQIAILAFMEFDMSGVGYKPTVKFLLNEISGVFTPFTLSPVQDPPSIYGPAGAALSYSPQRYYFSGTGSLARCRHLQVLVDFGTTSNGDELFTMTIYGRIMVER